MTPSTIKKHEKLAKKRSKRTDRLYKERQNHRLHLLQQSLWAWKMAYGDDLDERVFITGRQMGKSTMIIDQLENPNE